MTAVKFHKSWHGYQLLVVDRKKMDGVNLKYKECQLLMADHPTYTGPFSICFNRIGINIWTPGMIK